MDDRRVGLVVRALRRRRGWRQVDLAGAAAVSQPLISRMERGHIASLALATIRRVMAALDVRGELEPRWRGGELDRLLDERHARIGSLVTRDVVRGAGWLELPEVTFMRAGERGSIDLLGVNQKQLVALVQEIKSELTSFEETMRRLDLKGRVAAALVEERFGWRPRHVGVVLVLADTSTNRARAARVATLLHAALPARNVEIRQWLKAPSGDLRGVWFVRDIRGRADTRGPSGSHRVRRPRINQG